ncbi:TRAP transporter small permease subunit [uncultured Tistrella sp.]|uniref:TRAP transporter small permease subunit n=1 Tax=Tistrella mobilis TaxID=171437 RepID=UPI000C09C155|nr:TRAP transporter small permease subunit [uncultured Tistrella sp.]MAM73430.1 mannitol transporter [Tistrella sp.]
MTGEVRAPEPGPQTGRGLLGLADLLNTVVARVVVWLVPVMVVVTIMDVALRLFAGRATLWAFDATVQFYAAHFLLLGGFTLLRGGHVGVDILREQAGPRTGLVMDTLSWVAFFFPFAIVMVLWSWDFMIASWAIHETSPGVAALPVYPIKTLFFAGNLLLLIQGVAEFLRVLAGGFSRLKGV